MGEVEAESAALALRLAKAHLFPTFLSGTLAVSPKRSPSHGTN